MRRVDSPTEDAVRCVALPTEDAVGHRYRDICRGAPAAGGPLFDPTTRTSCSVDFMLPVHSNKLILFRAYRATCTQ